MATSRNARPISSGAMSPLRFFYSSGDFASGACCCCCWGMIKKRRTHGRAAGGGALSMNIPTLVLPGLTQVQGWKVLMGSFHPLMVYSAMSADPQQGGHGSYCKLIGELSS